MDITKYASKIISLIQEADFSNGYVISLPNYVSEDRICILIISKQNVFDDIPFGIRYNNLWNQLNAVLKMPVCLFHEKNCPIPLGELKAKNQLVDIKDLIKCIEK